jgi:hypothetical protein
VFGSSPGLKASWKTSKIFTPWAGTSLRCLWHGLRLQETRNSANQFVPGVYHFPLPEAFRDPVFRPSRTCHVVFDREVFLQVRDEDLGTVRGQPIRPVLAGFGEPVTDWLFQSALEARAGESAFCLRAGEGWLCVFALRWFGAARRLAAPDSVAVVFSGAAQEARLLAADEVMSLLGAAEGGADTSDGPASPPDVAGARRLAQQVLRERVQGREADARGTPGLSLVLLARVGA